MALVASVVKVVIIVIIVKASATSPAAKHVERARENQTEGSPLSYSVRVCLASWGAQEAGGINLHSTSQGITISFLMCSMC